MIYKNHRHKELRTQNKRIFSPNHSQKIDLKCEEFIIHTQLWLKNGMIPKEAFFLKSFTFNET